MATKTVKYEDLKKRLDRALGNSNERVITEATDSDRDRVYSTIVQVVLGISDYHNVDSNDLKRFIKYIIQDFHSDKNPDLDLDKHTKLLHDMSRILGEYSKKNGTKLLMDIHLIMIDVLKVKQKNKVMIEQIEEVTEQS